MPCAARRQRQQEGQGLEGKGNPSLLLGEAAPTGGKEGLRLQSFEGCGRVLVCHRDGGERVQPGVWLKSVPEGHEEQTAQSITQARLKMSPEATKKAEGVAGTGLPPLCPSAHC